MTRKTTTIPAETEPRAQPVAAVQLNGKRNKNIPPIVVFDENQKRMNERILNRKICERNEYHFVRVNKSKYRIIVSSIEQYDNTLAMLREVGIKYHTYTPNERKPIHVLFKNIPSCYEENDILDFLEIDHGLHPIRLTPFKTKYMLENNIQTTMWHASFDPKTDKSHIFNVKFIGNQYGITVEPIKNKSVTQCRRCWRFEHTQTKCTYEVRCPNCLATHNDGECALDTNKALKPACVNCKTDSHAANAKDCPIYTRILERKNNPGNKPPKQLKATNVAQNSNSPRNGSYASVVGPNQSQSKRNQPPNASNGDLKEFMKQLAIQQIQLNKMLMNIAPQLFCGSNNG